MPSQDNKNALYPVAMIKQAWGICRRNLRKLGVIYLIFNLPIIFASLTPLVKGLMTQQAVWPRVIWLFCVVVISSWGNIVLLLAASQAIGAQEYTVGNSINQAKRLLLKYVALILSVVLFAVGVIVVGVLAAAVIMGFLSQANKLLAFWLFIALVVAVISTLVYFFIRWSSAAQVCVLEGCGPLVALNKSFALIKKHINPVVGTYVLMVLMYILCVAPTLIAGAVLKSGKSASSAYQLGSTIYMLIVDIVFMPFWTTMTVILYNKLKEVAGADVYAKR